MITTMRGKYAITFALLLISSYINAWELPNLPSGKRTQYFLQHDDGGYKYGYDTAIDHFAKQAGDPNNEVAGHYVYQDANGRAVDVKYTAGINGFIPEGLEKLLPQTHGPSASPQGYIYRPPVVHPSDTTDDQSNTGDASYSFNIDTESHKRQETSDPAGNVQGGYSYTNEAGTHDISYIAGSNTGFVATSGSLAKPNGLFESRNLEYTNPRYASASRLDQPVNQNADGSYSFGYATDDQIKEENSDANGNVQGRYSYTNEAGTHDLSYVAGSETGFKPIGGSLSVPNGLIGQINPTILSTYSSQYPPAVEAISDTSLTPVISNPDGSYSFDFTTAHQSRQETSDANGNVQGKYSFTNEAGIHDLSYVAGSQTGFMPIGGSLALPNGLVGKSVSTSINSAASSDSYADSYSPSVSNSDGSYYFKYSAGDSNRQESSDGNGNVYGRYYYTNEAGDRDLSYIAGLGGFQPTSGSLATPNGLSTKSDSKVEQSVPQVKHAYVPPTTTYSSETTIDDNNYDEANTGDASYNFSIDTDEYKREESADSDGNVKGYYSYKNAAGTHDLSYAAGSETGFMPTGGSLAQPNGLKEMNDPTIYSYAPTSSEIYLPPVSAPLKTPNELNLASGDASYSFSIDTDEYNRKETSDALGNVVGHYSYRNKEGSHDLSYTAGSRTGFAATGGSLAVPNGITVGNFAGPFANPEYLPPLTRIDTKKANNIVIKQYYPSKSQSKYGYIYESS